jgi:LacI family transcriptional regulator
MAVGRPTIAKVTVTDVAERAGVSTATVSRVLTGRRGTGAEVAQRVHDAVDALGYVPDYLAKALRDQRTATLGFVVPDITNPFFPALIQAVEASARAASSSILLVDARNDPDEERRVAELLVSRRVDGILISPCHLTRSVALVEQLVSSVSVVQIDRVVSSNVASVSADHTGPMAQLAGIAARTGRQRAAFVGSELTVSTSNARQEAFAQQFGDTDRVLVGDFSVEWGRAAAHELVRRWPDVEFVVCASDLIAFGVIQELQTMGRRVPEDIAVTGWDDTLLAIASRPTITTVRQPIAEMARLAVELVTGIPVSASTVLPSTIVEGQSSG